MQNEEQKIDIEETKINRKKNIDTILNYVSDESR